MLRLPTIGQNSIKDLSEKLVRYYIKDLNWTVLTQRAVFFMWYRIIGIIAIVTFHSWNEGMAQVNRYDGFSSFESGKGARNVGLGESNGAEANDEFTSWTVNPANISPSSWSNAALHSSFFVGGIRSFSMTGLVSRDSLWPVAVGLSRTSFGQNTRYDAEGNPMGVFNASVTQMSLGTRRQLSRRFYLGASMLYDWRAVDYYSSHVLHFNIGAVFQADEKSSYGMTLSNLGYELIPFESQRHDLPLDLSVYWSRELNYLPFTFHLRMQKLNLWNRMTFQNPFQNKDQNINEPERESSRIKDFTEEVLRHMVIGGEFAFGTPAKVWLRFSYDHWRNLQLGIPGIRSLEGVAVGVGFQLKVLKLDYTWERLYFDSGSHQVSLSFRLFEKDRRRRGF